MSDQSNEESSGNDEQESYAPTWLGWAVRIFSVVIFLGMVGLIVTKVTSEDEPILFKSEVMVEDIRQESDGYFIPVQVTNEGSRTANRVKMELDVAGEKSEIEIDMIGADEKARFVVVRPASAENVKHTILSYEAP